MNKKEVEKQSWVDRWLDHRWGMLTFTLTSVIIASAILAPPMFIFSTFPHTYLVKDATIEQVEQMIQADPDDRVWYSEANLLAQGSNLLEITFLARTFEEHKIAEYLDSIGVEYRKLKPRNLR